MVPGARRRPASQHARRLARQLAEPAAVGLRGDSQAPGEVAAEHQGGEPALGGDLLDAAVGALEQFLRPVQPLAGQPLVRGGPGAGGEPRRTTGNYWSLSFAPLAIRTPLAEAWRVNQPAPDLLTDPPRQPEPRSPRLAAWAALGVV